MRPTTRPGGDEGKCRNTPQGVSYRGGARCLTMAAKQCISQYDNLLMGEVNMKAEEILRKCGFKNAAAVSAAAAQFRSQGHEIKLTAFAVKLIEGKFPRISNDDAGVIRDKRRTLGIKPGRVVVKGTRAMAIAEALYEGSLEEIYAFSNCDAREWGNGFPHYDARRRIGW